jgi:hypothetical protein
MKAHWLDQFEQEQELRYCENHVYTPPQNPLENLSTDQIIKKIESCLGSTTRPLWNEFLRRLNQ